MSSSSRTLKIRCMACANYSTDRLTDFEQHVASKLRIKRLWCPKCSTDFSQLRHYRTHYRNKHGGNKIPEPKHDSVSDAELSRYVLAIGASNRPLTVGDRILCLECEELVSAGASFRVHLFEQHLCEQPAFRCPRCVVEQSFISLELLQLHLCTQHPGAAELEPALLTRYRALEAELVRRADQLTHDKHHLGEVNLAGVYSHRSVDVKINFAS